MWRHVPNLVTAGRGLCGPVVAWLLIAQQAPQAAFALFTAAAFTDLFDGWLAQRLGSDRVLGAFLDPLADKVLGACTWVALAWIGWAPLWLVGPLLARDAIIALLWAVYRRRGIQWRASPFGQVATSYEATALGLLLFHGPFWGVDWPTVGAWVGLQGLCLSYASALGYAVHGPPPVTRA